MTARVLRAEDFSLELQHSGASSLALPYRRCHVVSFYLGPSVRVARGGRWGRANEEFSRGTTGIYPAGKGERIDWQGPTVALHLHLRPAMVEKAWRARDGIGALHLQRVFLTNDRVLRTLGGGLFDCARTVGMAAHQQAIELIKSVVTHLIDRYAIEGERPMVSPRIGQATLDELLDTMHGSGAAETDVAALAKQAGLSDRRFRQAFKQQFGASPHDYLVRCRLELAKHLIQCDRAPPTAIAQDTGFYDLAHFSRTFKTRIGVSPSAFALWLRA